MRVSTGLRAAVIPAVLLGLAACSDTPDVPETTIPVATQDSGGTTAATDDPADPTVDDTADATDDESTAPVDPANVDIYTQWSGITECPTLDEVNAATGLDLTGEETNYDAARGALTCNYGAPDVMTGRVASVEVAFGPTVTPLTEPNPQEIAAAGIDGGILPASDFGSTAWYVYTMTNAGAGVPGSCVLGATGTNLNGDTVNVIIVVGDSETSNPASLCDPAGNLATIG